ncbi:GNAT family N-acetyltransferase [Streptomyces sp. NPDC093228]|uniref:GNAT family N-acetyltransferase n=1 Tax=Streptomyces sp. NPDC093228 TaxID=3155070 RepID=UPI00342D8985
MLHVEHRPTETYSARIEIHPDHRNLGTGSRLIRSFLHQARRQSRHLTLDILVIKGRARALYRRLGLNEVTRHGENSSKIKVSTELPRPGPIHRSGRASASVLNTWLVALAGGRHGGWPG